MTPAQAKVPSLLTATIGQRSVVIGSRQGHCPLPMARVWGRADPGRPWRSLLGPLASGRRPPCCGFPNGIVRWQQSAGSGANCWCEVQCQLPVQRGAQRGVRAAPSPVSGGHDMQWTDCATPPLPSPPLRSSSGRRRRRGTQGHTGAHSPPNGRPQARDRSPGAANCGSQRADFCGGVAGTTTTVAGLKKRATAWYECRYLAVPRDEGCATHAATVAALSRSLAHHSLSRATCATLTVFDDTSLSRATLSGGRTQGTDRPSHPNQRVYSAARCYGTFVSTPTPLTRAAPGSEQTLAKKKKAQG